jgi:hypothetical protein
VDCAGSADAENITAPSAAAVFAKRDLVAKELRKVFIV